MAYQNFLHFLTTDAKKDLIFEVREAEIDRLEAALDRHKGAKVSFFRFETVTGRTFVINLARVQAVRHVWDAASGPSDLVRDDGGLHVKLAGKDPMIEHSTENEGSISGLFTDLLNSAGSPWPSFLDEDGELMRLQRSEVVWVSAATHVIAEELKLVNET